MQPLFVNVLLEKCNLFIDEYDKISNRIGIVSSKNMQLPQFKEVVIIIRKDGKDRNSLAMFSWIKIALDIIVIVVCLFQADELEGERIGSELCIYVE